MAETISTQADEFHPKLLWLIGTYMFIPKELQRQEYNNNNWKFQETYKNLESLIEKFNFDWDQFESEKGKLVGQLLRFFGEYEMDLSTLWIRTETFITLCLADQWLNLENSKCEPVEIFKQQRAITYRFKLFCNQDSKLEKQASQGNKTAQYYFPEYKEKNETTKFVPSISYLLANYVDHNRSKFVLDNLKTLCPELFEQVLMFGADPNQLNFKIQILTLNSGQCKEYYDAIAFISRYQGQNNIFIPYDINEFKSVLIHEVRHALSENWRLGEFEIMGSGIDEAITESGVPNPKYYRYQRYILELITSNRPELATLIDDVYKGEQEVLTLLKSLLSEFGSEGVINFLFTYYTSKTNIDSRELKQIVLDIPESVEFFNQGKDNKNWDLTKKLVRAEHNLKQIYSKTESQETLEDLEKLNKIIASFPLEYLVKISNDTSLFNQLLQKLETGVDDLESKNYLEINDNLSSLVKQVLTITFKLEAKYLLQNIQNPIFSSSDAEFKPTSKL